MYQAPTMSDFIVVLNEIYLKLLVPKTNRTCMYGKIINIMDKVPKHWGIGTFLTGSHAGHKILSPLGIWKGEKYGKVYTVFHT